MISRGEGIRTPGPMLPKHVRYQTALHPGASFPRSTPQATSINIHDLCFLVNHFFFFFEKNLRRFRRGSDTKKGTERTALYLRLGSLSLGRRSRNNAINQENDDQHGGANDHAIDGS